MLSFTSLAFLAIAAQSLFAGVDAAVLPKRQSILPTQNITELIQSIVAGLDLSSLPTGPFNVSATFPLGGSQPSGGFQQLIPAAFTGIAGPGNNVSVTGVPGQLLSTVGLGFAPFNATGAGGFDPTAIFSQIGPIISQILSGVGNSTFSTFLIAFPGFNGTTPFQGPDGALPTFPGAPNVTVFPTPFRAALPTDLPTTLPTDLPTTLPTDLPTTLPTDLPTTLPTDLPTTLPTDLPTDLPVPPTDVPVPTTDVPVPTTDVPVEPSPTEPVKVAS